MDAHPHPAFLLIVLFAVSAWSGCLGGDEAPRPPVPGDPADDPGPVADGDRAFGKEALMPWIRTERIGRLPDPLRIGQVEHTETPNGSLRLLTDGPSFALVVDDSLDPYPEDAVVAARIMDREGGFDVARAVLRVGDGAELEAAGRRIVPVPAFEPIRYTNLYAFEVLVVLPDPSATLVVDPIRAEEDPDTERSLLPDMVAAQNMSLLWSWTGPLSFRPAWSLGFDGPDEGRDAPDPVERPLFGGTETGTYTLRLEGTRIWLTDILVDLSRSRVASTDPDARAEGGSTFRFQVDGFHPIAYYLDLLPDRGLDQSFTMKVDVDYETTDDLQQPEDQTFFFSATVGYRAGPETYVAGTDSRTIDVRIAGSIPDA